VIYTTGPTTVYINGELIEGVVNVTTGSHTAPAITTTGGLHMGERLLQQIRAHAGVMFGGLDEGHGMTLDELLGDDSEPGS
jgi:hypothetical protein